MGEQQAVSNSPPNKMKKHFGLESRDEVKNLIIRFIDLVEHRKFFLIN